MISAAAGRPEDGDVVAGTSPRACRAAPTARASSWIWRHGHEPGSPSARHRRRRRSGRRSARRPPARAARSSTAGVRRIHARRRYCRLRSGIRAASRPTASAHDLRLDRMAAMAPAVAWTRCRPSPSHDRAADADDDAPPTATRPRSPSEIELRWQDCWDANGTFEAPNPAGPLADPDGVAERGRKLFVLDMFPYPSGTGLHVGHPLGLHRHRRLQPLPAHDRAQRAVHDGLRRVRPAGRAVRRADRPAPGRSRPPRTSPPTAASCAASG